MSAQPRSNRADRALRLNMVLLLHARKGRQDELGPGVAPLESERHWGKAQPERKGGSSCHAETSQSTPTSSVAKPITLPKGTRNEVCRRKKRSAGPGRPSTRSRAVVTSQGADGGKPTRMSRAERRGDGRQGFCQAAGGSPVCLRQEGRGDSEEACGQPHEVSGVILCNRRPDTGGQAARVSRVKPLETGSLVEYLFRDGLLLCEEAFPRIAQLACQSAGKRMESEALRVDLRREPVPGQWCRNRSTRRARVE